MTKKPHALTKKSLGILIISVCLALMMTGVGIYAAYTNSRHAQRTIATYDALEEAFSSNDLGSGYAKDNIKTVYTRDDEHDPTTVVTICNYERGKQTHPSETDVTYVLSARLVKYDANVTERYVAVDAAYLSANSLTGYTVTISKGLTSVTLGGATLSTNAFGGTLTGGQAHSDAYTVTFDVEFATERPNLYLEMTATPSDEDMPVLRGIFKTEVRLEGATNAWTGEFMDSTDKTPAEYDGFNYLISGVGRGTCTISWDNTKVDLSYVSVAQLMAITGATQTASSITFAVDSDEVSRYELQFYKVDITTQTWVNMNNSVVRLEFHA